MNFGIASGEWIAIMGESGSGKSTLLTIMGALNSPSRGKYWVDKIDVYALGQEERADFRRNTLGFVFQSFHLIPYLTVRENVILPLTPVRVKEKEKRAMADRALDRVGLAAKGHRLPSQISGGEQERVTIARALVNKPPILLADEPTGNLDTKTTWEVMNLLKELSSDGMTIIMVTHNHECARYAGRILRLSDVWWRTSEIIIFCAGYHYHAFLWKYVYSVCRYLFLNEDFVSLHRNPFASRLLKRMILVIYVLRVSSLQPQKQKDFQW